MLYIGIEYKYNNINGSNVYYDFIRLCVRRTVNVLSNNCPEFLYLSRLRYFQFISLAQNISEFIH